MTAEQETLSEIQTAIKGLSPESQEAIQEMAEHFRRIIKQAPDGEGQMALALVGAELAAE